MKIKDIIKSFSCKHEVEFIRNIHGDEINYRNARSQWRCRKCGRNFYMDEYIDTEEAKDKTNIWYHKYVFGEQNEESLRQIGFMTK